MRYYPTDLLLAVERIEQELTAKPGSPVARLLDLAGLSGLAGLFDGAALAEGLDGLFGGLSQYPWQPLIDSNDVYEFSPIGTVVLDDRDASNTLRGLILGWATGNEVAIRTSRQPFWRDLMDILRQQGFPLPAGRTGNEREHVLGGHLVDVPDLVTVLPQQPPQQKPGQTADTPPAGSANALRIRVDPELTGSDCGAGIALALDCRAAWVHQLFRRDYLMGTRLSAARSRDIGEEAGRLDAKLRYLVQRARRTPYYRDLPPVQGIGDLTRLPIMDKADLEAHSLPSSRDLCSDTLPTGEVLRSGGSSGDPRYVVYSRTDWHNMVREAIPLFYGLGLRKGDRLINTLFGGKMYGGMTTTVSELSRMPLECYTTGQLASVDDVLMLSASFNANAILAQPAMLLPLLRNAKARRPDLRIEKVIYGGTPMAESDKTWLRDQLGTRVISSILAANDGAQLGYQCGELGGMLHHICEDYNLIEVVDQDGNTVPEGERGDLLITSMQKFEGPLIRYRIGDCGRIFQHDCACGVSGRILEYTGRSDGQIEIISRRVIHSDVLAALEVFGVSQLQIEITSRNGKEIMIVRTESPGALDSQEVRNYLIEKLPVLGELHDFDADLDLFELVVECFPAGELTRNAVSGKIKSVIDRRLT
ncbi:MAG: phenylacetate--CoA ligase family protein [Pseudonocardiaceae bacterium]